RRPTSGARSARGPSATPYSAASPRSRPLPPPCLRLLWWTPGALPSGRSMDDAQTRDASLLPDPGGGQLLRQTEERFRLLVEAVQDYALFMLDPDGRVASWNAGAQRIKGWRADEIIGQHFSKFYPPEALARGWPEHELVVARREGRFEDE